MAFRPLVELRPLEHPGHAVDVLGLLGPALLPHAGVLLLSVSRVWSLSPLPTAYTLGHYEEILVRSPQFIANTLRYAGLAALIDVALGAVIAWLLASSSPPGTLRRGAGRSSGSVAPHATRERRAANGAASSRTSPRPPRWPLGWIPRICAGVTRVGSSTNEVSMRAS